MRQISQKLRTFEEMTSKRGSCMGKAPCCPVSREQEIWIVLKLDAYSNITQLRRDLRIHYLMPNRKPLSQRYAFQRIVNRFKTTTYEEVKSKEKICGPESFITDDFIEKVVQKCVRPKKMASFNIISRIKLENMLMF